MGERRGGFGQGNGGSAGAGPKHGGGGGGRKPGPGRSGGGGRRDGAPRGQPRKPKPGPSFDRPGFPDAWTVVIHQSAVNLVTVGHPWLFSGAIATLDAPTGPDQEPGGLAIVLSPEGKPLALGLCNPQSQIAVRMIGRLESEEVPARLPSLQSLVVARMESASALRKALGRPADDRTAYRLVNSEGDMLPGLTVDRLGEGASVIVSSAGGKKMLGFVADWLMGPGGCSWVIARSANDAHPSEELPAGTMLSRGDVPESLVVQHGGAKISVDPSGGQKGGIYTDQLDNHRAVAALAHGRFVIDAYCHMGGFGLHAALAGARRVLAIDASQKAVEAAQEAALLTGVDGRFEAVCGDAVHLLGDLAAGVGAEMGRPGLIILDPPKFATRADVVEDALRKYSHVNAVAMSALEPGGYLVSCSCSGRIDRTTFLRMLGHAARRAGRDLQLLELRGPAADHPSSPVHAESHYLKVAICRVL